MSNTGYINAPEIGDRAKFSKILSIFAMYDVSFDSLNVEGVSALHLAADAGNVKLIDWLLRKKADINVSAGHAAHFLQGSTPLMYAARYLSTLLDFQLKLRSNSCRMIFYYVCVSISIYL